MYEMVKHHELIRAVLDGKQVEWRPKTSPVVPEQPWKICPTQQGAVSMLVHATYADQSEFRLYEPPVQDVVYHSVYMAKGGGYYCGSVVPRPSPLAQGQHGLGWVKMVIDPDRGVVKSIEFLSPNKNAGRSGEQAD